MLGRAYLHYDAFSTAHHAIVHSPIHFQPLDPDIISICMKEWDL